MVTSKLGVAVGVVLLLSAGSAQAASSLAPSTSTLTWRMWTLERRMQTLERELGATRGRVAQCEANLAAAESEREHLRNAVFNVENQTHMLMEEQDEFVGSFAAIQSEWPLLRNAVFSLEAQTHMLMDGADELRGSLGVMQSEWPVLQNAVSSLETQAHMFMDDGDGLRGDLGELRERLSTVEEQNLLTAEVLACMPPPEHEWLHHGQCWSFGRSFVVGDRATREQCQNACIADGTCIGYNFTDPNTPAEGPAHVSSNCFLFTECEDKEHSLEHFVGWETSVVHRLCPAFTSSAPPPSYVDATGECFGGVGYWGAHGASEAQCQDSCDTSPTCLGYSWDYRDEGNWMASNCWLIEECASSGAPMNYWSTSCRGTPDCSQR